MGILAVTRELGSLGTFIAEQVAQRRGYRYVRREILAEAARFGEISEQQLIEAVEVQPGVWERISEPGRRQYLHVAAAVLEFASEDNVVILGRWSTMLLRGVRHAVRVRVCAPPGLRIERMVARLHLSSAEAQAVAQRYDDGVRARLRQFFDVEWTDSALYDLVINTQRVTVDEACGLIERLLDASEFQPDEASRQEVRDRALAARVLEAMKMDERLARTDLHITAHRGEVTLEGLVFAPDAHRAADEVARGVPGVRAVTNSLRVTRIAPE